MCVCVYILNVLGGVGEMRVRSEGVIWAGLGPATRISTFFFSCSLIDQGRSNNE